MRRQTQRSAVDGPRERAMPFNVDMVRAILDGRKTQTRRVVKPQPSNPHPGILVWKNDEHFPETTFPKWMAERCPYGQPGNRLWVRETWAYFGGDEYLYQKEPGSVGYRAEHDGLASAPGGRWRPSIHMPRWASRLTLEVVSVRVERLQAISEEDARAEGVERHPEPFTSGYRNYEPEPSFESVTYHPTARESFASLWRSINGAESWDANPWVWRIEFARVEASHVR